MIPVALLKKFGSLTFITGIEISHMTRHSSKPNKLRNVKSKKISNDQELIQSDPISRLQNQKGNN